VVNSKDAHHEDGEHEDENGFWAKLKPSDLESAKTLHLTFPVNTATEHTHSAASGLKALEVGETNTAPINQDVFTDEFIKRLKGTEVTNMKEIIEDLNECCSLKPLRFSLDNPYWFPARVEGKKWRANENVLTWYANYEIDPHVCAVKFLDTTKTRYEMRTFPSAGSMTKEWIVTHAKQCGACSTLKDLAIYIRMRDLTAPVRSCTKNIGLVAIRDCLTKNVGLTKECAEAWAYDSSNTKFFCTLTCIKDYGLENIVLSNFTSLPDNLPNGSLRPCIECDEDMSGAGFKYGAGRTRRNSGIVSSIEREKGEIANVDQSLYFK